MKAAHRVLLPPLGHLAVLLGLSLFLFSCSTIPVTERRGLHLVPDSELTSLSYQEYDKVLKTSKLSTDMT